MLSSPVHGICMLAMMCCCLLVEACCCSLLCSRVGALGRVPQSPRNLQSVRLMAASPHADLEAAMVRRQHPHMAGQQAAALGGARLSVLCCAPARGVLQVAGLQAGKPTMPLCMPRQGLCRGKTTVLMHVAHHALPARLKRNTPVCLARCAVPCPDTWEAQLKF